MRKFLFLLSFLASLVGVGQHGLGLLAPKTLSHAGVAVPLLAAALGGFDIKVFAGQFVPALAVGLLGLSCGLIFTAQSIDLRSYLFQVRRIAASDVPAQVVYMTALGGNADQFAEYGTVCARINTVPRYITIPGTIESPEPIPATSNRARHQLLCEAFR